MSQYGIARHRTCTHPNDHDHRENPGEAFGKQSHRSPAWMPKRRGTASTNIVRDCQPRADITLRMATMPLGWCSFGIFSGKKPSLHKQLATCTVILASNDPQSYAL